MRPRLASGALDGRLKRGAQAAKWFSGRDCVLCKDPIWEVGRKNIG